MQPFGLRHNMVSSLFFISTLLVLLVAIVVTVYMNRTVRMVEISTQNHLRASAVAASSLLDAEELDRFHAAEDMEKPEWEIARAKLAKFAEQYQVLYVYYWRDYGDGRIQYIIDNDTDPETMATPDMFYPIDDPEDPVTSAAVPYILAGNIYTSDLGIYTKSWDGLISGTAPVFNEDGTVYCAAGVDLSDETIIIQRRNMTILRTVLICALTLSLFAGGAGMWFYDQKARQSENANKAKSQFLSAMSHEIRTPMNAVIGISELVLRENISPRVQGYIGQIKQAGTSLLAIINDILDFSKIESGKMEIHSAKYALPSILNDVVTIIGIRLHEKSLEFKVDIDSSLPCLLSGDEIRIRQILLNILNNAVKYTKEGYIEFRVSGKITGKESINIKFEISDSGIGIKEEDLKKIFGDFVRFDTAKNRNIEGTGLGLAITYNLCRLMGGNVSVTSVYGKGSTFTVVLPQKILDAKPIGGSGGEPWRLVPAEGAAYENNLPKQIVSFTAPDARILIVDDVSINLLVAEGLLAPYKMQIVCCTGGAEAISLMEKNHYDLVLMDHLMPEMNGIETTARIRALEAQAADGFFSRIPVVALTADAIVGMKEMFLENGFDDYLSKPIEISAMHAIIKKWIPKEKQIVAG
ncbi:MAG: response regulator [Treponema sp.]|jgi:signal transduction histidine kinase/ActR/RegA family two-component response regulator|nr:response regulator [Treponema sp.]